MVGVLEDFIMGKPNTNFHQVAWSPSHHAPSACTSPPYDQPLPAAASGTSGRHADTPSGPRLPRDLPLRYRSKGQVEVGWRDQSQRHQSHLMCRRGSDSLSPGCWRWRWKHHVSTAVTSSPRKGNLWQESQLVCTPECPDQPVPLPSRCLSAWTAGDWAQEKNRKKNLIQMSINRNS